MDGGTRGMVVGLGVSSMGRRVMVVVMMVLSHDGGGWDSREHDRILRVVVEHLTKHQVLHITLHPTTDNM